MNKLNTFFIISTILFCFVSFLPKRAIGAVGDTYNQMTSIYGAPKASMTLSMMAGNNPIKRQYYQSNGVTAYIFNATEKIMNSNVNITVHAYFNKKDVCYKMTSNKNHLIPSPSVFVGSLASTKPVTISTVPNLVLQYGSDSNKVIFMVSGITGNFRATAYSPALKP